MATTTKRLYTVLDTDTGAKALVRSSTPGRARNRYRAMRLEVALAGQDELYQFGAQGVPILDEDDAEAAEALEVLDASEGQQPEHRPATAEPELVVERDFPPSPTAAEAMPAPDTAAMPAHFPV